MFIMTPSWWFLIPEFLRPVMKNFAFLFSLLPHSSPTKDQKCEPHTSVRGANLERPGSPTTTIRPQKGFFSTLAIPTFFVMNLSPQPPV